jgi:2-hydroxychromene-2-carboxylate isomerase
VKLTRTDSACWEYNANVSDESVLQDTLTKGGYNGADLIAKAKVPAIKAKLRELTAEAKSLGICGVPTYRVLRDDGSGGWKNVGGLVWGQDETNIVEDLIAGWDPESSNATAEVRRSEDGGKFVARL